MRFGDQGRREVVARSGTLQQFPARQQPPPLLLGQVDIEAVLVQLVLRHHGADIRARFQGVSDL
ncbi:hypothetical protein D3C79_1029090 [compost metagenome]